MRFYPQLTTGATCLYPFSKTRRTRTIGSESPSGSTVKLADDAGAAVEWDLGYRGMSDAEAAGLQALFDSTEGRYREFTFLDPADNLLRWSEDFEQPVWQELGLLVLSAGFPDPTGGNGATQIANPTAVDLRIEQEIDGPAWYHYAFSVFLRSDSGTVVRLTRSSTNAEETGDQSTSQEWHRRVLSGRLSGADESIRFGIVIPAGKTAEVYGCQAEAQPGASTYRKTTSRSGVYTRCRFGSDSLRITTEGPNHHGCRVQLRALPTN